MRHRVFVDTNFIIAAHEARLWKALASRHALETVEKCREECHNGCQNRHPETWIDDRDLLASLASPPHPVDDAMRAEVLLKEGGAALHEGERDIWAAVLCDPGAWIVSGPDRASMKFGIYNGYGDRLLSMEDLVGDRKEFNRRRVPSQYNRKFLDQVRAMCFQEAGRIPRQR